MKRMVLATLALAASAASWADVGVFVGGSLGKTSNDLNCSALSLQSECNKDSNATGWKVYGGYRITPVIAVEGTYFNFGKVDWSGTSRKKSAAVAGDDSAKAFGLGAGFHFDLTPQWSTDVHLGYARVKSVSDVGTTRSEAYKNDAYIGIDGGFLVAKGFRIRAGWDFATALEPVSQANYHLNLFSVGGSYEF